MGVSIVLILQCNPKTASQDQAAKLMSLSTCMMQPFPILVDFQRSVYDQTCLVVLSETFHELELTQHFYQYATAASFQIWACIKGYDPESKNKVEVGVKYVKNNALCGKTFSEQENCVTICHYLKNWPFRNLHKKVDST